MHRCRESWQETDQSKQRTDVQRRQAVKKRVRVPQDVKGNVTINPAASAIEPNLRRPPSPWLWQQKQAAAAVKGAYCFDARNNPRAIAAAVRCFRAAKDCRAEREHDERLICTPIAVRNTSGRKSISTAGANPTCRGRASRSEAPPGHATTWHTADRPPADRRGIPAQG